MTRRRGGARMTPVMPGEVGCRADAVTVVDRDPSGRHCLTSSATVSALSRIHRPVRDETPRAGVHPGAVLPPTLDLPGFCPSVYPVPQRFGTGLPLSDQALAWASRNPRGTLVDYRVCKSRAAGPGGARDGGLGPGISELAARLPTPPGSPRRLPAGAAPNPGRMHRCGAISVSHADAAQSGSGGNSFHAGTSLSQGNDA